MKLLYLVDRRYPTTHAFLETVYTKIFPRRGHQIYWIMRTRQNKKFCEVRRWNNSIVLSFSLPDDKKVLSTHIFNIKTALTAFILMRRVQPNIAQVRNWTWGAFIACCLRISNRIPFVYQYSFPRHLILSENIKNEKSKLKVRSVFELFWLKRLIRRADLIFPISKTMKNNMVKDGYKKNILIPIGLAFDSDINVEKIDNRKIIEHYNLKDKNVVLYFGVMDKKRELEFLLDVWSMVCNQLSDCLLLMVGGSDKDISRLKKYSEQLRIFEYVIFTGSVNRERIPSFIKSAKLTVSPIPPKDVYNVSSVTKVYESLGCGCPVIGNALPEQGRLIRESGGGICVDYEKNEFSKAIIHLLRNTELTNKMGIKGKEYILNNRTYEHMADAIESAYNNLN